VSFFFAGLREAWHLIITGNPYLVFVTRITLQVAGVATLVGLLIGLPIGITLGAGRFRGRGPLLVVANLGLGLPPVVVGLFLVVAMYPAGPLGSLHLVYTLKGVYIAQSCLSTPIIVALTASAVRDLPDGLLDQARAFGASRIRVGFLALREARIGIMAATIAAVGSALSEVGAVILVGGNSVSYDQTLASAVIERWGSADIAGALAVGLILMALILIITAALTWLQYGKSQRVWLRAS
jgi:tungstate transport system permease protein